MSKIISLTINNKKLKGKAGQTILEVSKENGIDMPSLCYHSDLEASSSCRICLVKIKGQSCPVTACSTGITEGMDITTDTPEIRALRKTNLELLFSQHKEECPDCVYQFNCELLRLAKEYGVEINRFKDRKTKFPAYQFGPALIFDSSKCIDCRACVQMCEAQGVGYLKVKEKGHLFQVVPSAHKECVYCGQCLVHCPTGAFEGVGEFEDAEAVFKKAPAGKGASLVVQFAPSIRTSIGEEFGMKPGEVVTDKLVGALKKLGADYVFDVSVGADFTTTEEAGELVDKLNSGRRFTMFSSCCPAWVRFVELYYPEFIPNLTTARPPHIILGGLIKTYFQRKENLNPNSIKVVSIMPCVAKKYEITRKELKINGLKPVDYVLTTRELAFLFKKHKIDLKKIKLKKADRPLGVPSGAGVIYGASGGVMESALRTAWDIVNSIPASPAEKEGIVKTGRPRLEFKQVRGQQGIKTFTLKFGKRKMRFAAVNGLGKAKNVLGELKKNPKAYDCVEVMACLGGCIGGGGQPMPTDRATRQERADGLYKIDKKKKNRIAHQNPIVEKVYGEFLTNKKIIKAICHTSYSPKKRVAPKIIKQKNV